MDVSSVALGGLNQAQANLENTGRRINGAAEQGDLVDLSTNAVARLQAKGDFEANIQVLKVADQLEKSAINLIA